MEDKKTNQVLVNVILDRSGSMGSTRAETISGYNSYLDALRKDDKIQYFITLIQFDSPTGGPELTVKYVDKPLAEVPALMPADYEPRGWTPLYDAIGECIRRVETKDRSVLTVIITDGAENASTEFTRETIKALIADKEKNEHWTFTFLGADIDSYAASGSLGVNVVNTSNYVKGMEEQAYSALAKSTMERSYLASNVGMHAASMWCMFDDSQRQSMGDDLSQKPHTTGGRPAVPPTFRQPQPPQRPIPSRTRTSWRTSA